MSAAEEPKRFYQPSATRPFGPTHADFVFPVRLNRSPRIQGYFQSLITNSAQPFHSILEKECLQIVDLMPSVRNLKAQPERIRISTTAGDFLFTPDILLDVNGNRSIYLEVKLKDQANSPYYAWRWPLITSHLKRSGAQFRIITEHYLHREPRRSNVRQLQIYRAAEPDPAIAYALEVELAKSGTLLMADAIQAFDNSALAKMSIFSLILRRRLHIPLNMPLDDRSVLSLSR